MTLKRGSGTFLEFSITAVMLTSILLMIVNLFIKRYAIEDFELVANQISRDIVVCSSIEQAKEKADKEAQSLADMVSHVNYLETEVNFAPGSDEEWKKGNYILIKLKGVIAGYSRFVPSEYVTERLVMIENDGF